jgi:adenylate kinase family enzyme
VQRVVVLGRGAAGKSTAARRLGQRLGLPVVELDRYFWRPGLVPTPEDEWVQLQHELAAADRWVMDGDLGPYDVLAARLARADTVLILDFPVLLCAWRALRRSPERVDFWWWMVTWRRRSKPAVLTAVTTFAPSAGVHLLRTPRQLEHFLMTISA